MIKVPEDYKEDCKRIVSVCAKNDKNIDIMDAYLIWNSHSDRYDAGWLILPKSDYGLRQELSEYFE